MAETDDTLWAQFCVMLVVFFYLSNLIFTREQLYTTLRYSCETFFSATDKYYGFCLAYFNYTRTVFSTVHCFACVAFTARVICGAGSMKRYGVRPSVCPVRPVQERLLLGARRVGDIDRLLPKQRAAGWQYVAKFSKSGVREKVP